MRLVLFGSPGSGKGTQAQVLAEKLNIPTISTGSIFRGIVAGGGERAEEIASYINNGQFVPDETVNELVEERLSQPDTANGFLLDGYPRTLDQLKTLDEMLAAHGTPLDHAILLEVPFDEIVIRLLKRAKVEGRADDTEEVIRTRLKVYSDQTAPLAQAYEEQGILTKVDGLGSIDEVQDRLAEVL